MNTAVKEGETRVLLVTAATHVLNSLLMICDNAIIHNFFFLFYNDECMKSLC